jgi:signal transduction histidine kinase
MAGELPNEDRIFLSTLPAGAGNRRLALAVVLVSVAIFFAAAPFATVPLLEVWAFIPAYESALVINDLITAVLLFGQFSFLRSPALLVLASGYLFTALMAVSHALTFPGLFSPSGLLGAGPQSTAWLYMFWHGGFPLLVAAYALLKDNRQKWSGTGSKPHARMAILTSLGAVLAVVCGLTLLATAGQEVLPSIMQGHHYTPAMIVIVSSVWALSLSALIILWRRRPHTVLDLWLMVVMCAWLFDTALAAVLNAGRFDLGFYAGRIYGLLAASFVLVVLLMENSVLYARLVAAHESERRERQRVQERTMELITVNKELESFSYSVSHDLRSPLRAIDGYSQILGEDYANRLDEEGRRVLGVVRESSKRMGVLIDELLAFSRLGRAAIVPAKLDTRALVKEAIDELHAAGARPARIEVAQLPAAWGDRILLKQVWVNLLSNALKYTGRRDSAVIEIAGWEQDHEVVYSVKDNGVGFDMRYYDKLFGVFQRLHTAEEFPGTGVGLAIVQRIVTRHGGRVWADAKPGEGATFCFALQAGPRDEASAGNRAALGL